MDTTITKEELIDLVNLNILKAEEYSFEINGFVKGDLTKDESTLLNWNKKNTLNIDEIKNNKQLKMNAISISATVKSLVEKNIITCTEIRYDFKNTKISTGLNGINRVFLPSSNIFPTLVASDTNDYITLINIHAKTEEEYKTKFINEVYRKENYRKITKEEACRIQGFPENFILPENRARWMKLLGNSVTVPVIEILGKAIIGTGVFEKQAEPIELGM